MSDLYTKIQTHPKIEDSRDITCNLDLIRILVERFEEYPYGPICCFQSENEYIFCSRVKLKDDEHYQERFRKECRKCVEAAKKLLNQN